MNGAAPTAALALPAPQAMVAPATWQRIDFFSDLHLSADTPRTFDAWVTHMRETDADAVFILGDLVEVWVGDDARFEGFDAHFAETFAALSSLRPTHFMVGNRDFLIGHELLDACGVTPLSDPVTLTAFGQTALLTHGDELCLDDVEYQRFRRQVRDPNWQRQILAQPLSTRRAFARQVREQSEASHRDTDGDRWTDIDPAAAVHWLTQAGAGFMIHGHTHRPASQTLAPGLERHVLSDWDLEDSTRAGRAEVLRWTADGLERRPPTRAARR